MSRRGGKRKDLVESLTEAFRRQSRVTVLMHQAIAQRVGLSAGEHKCLDLLLAEGPLTAGQIADACGITTGAVTGLLDRLEDARFARRERDPHDRRRVIVQVEVARVMRDIAPLFRGLAAESEAMLGDYTEKELSFLLAFVTRCTEFAAAHTQKIRTMRVRRK